MTRSYDSKPMTQKQGRLQFQMLVAGCTDAALDRLTPKEIAASYAGVSVQQAAEALLNERLRRSTCRV